MQWRTDSIISERTTLLEAMSLIDKKSQKVLFVTDSDYKLKAALTDGDIRRWILSQGNLDAEVSSFANYSPKFLLEGERHKAKVFMAEKQIEAVPIVDSEQIILDIETVAEITEVPNDSLSGVPVVINAGGLGTRLYPYTRILPKPLIPIGEIPIVQHIVNSFRFYGCREFYLIVNHKKNMIKAYFSESSNDCNIVFIDEDKPLGTGGGLSLLKKVISEPFFFTNCDILVKENIEKIYNQHVKMQHVITMVCSLKDYVIPYGTIDIGPSGQIVSMKEKPHLSFFVNTGLYVVDSRVVEEMELNVPKSFPEVTQEYLNRGESVGVFPVSQNSWMDMGQPEGMEDMIQRLSQG